MQISFETSVIFNFFWCKKQMHVVIYFILLKWLNLLYTYFYKTFLYWEKGDDTKFDYNIDLEGGPDFL